MSEPIHAECLVRTVLLADAYDLLVKVLEGEEVDPSHVDRVANDIWEALHIDG